MATFYQLRQAISASMNDANDFGKSILQHQRCILFQDQNENQTSYSAPYGNSTDVSLVFSVSSKVQLACI